MGFLTGWLASAGEGPFSTGSELGDITSYTVGAAILGGAWRLFRWWRADQKEMDGSHQAVEAKLRRNQALLLAHIMLLVAALARTQEDVPPFPTLEE